MTQNTVPDLCPASARPNAQTTIGLSGICIPTLRAGVRGVIETSRKDLKNGCPR